MKGPVCKSQRLPLLLEEVEAGKHDVCNYYTQGYFPGGREWVPKFLGNSSREWRVKRIGKRWRRSVETSIKEEARKGLGQCG